MWFVGKLHSGIITLTASSVLEGPLSNYDPTTDIVYANEDAAAALTVRLAVCDLQRLGYTEQPNKIKTQIEFYSKD